MKDIYSFKNNYKAIEFVLNQLSANQNLNDWEKGFIKNNKEYVINNHGFLSEPQLEKLSDLWEKY